MLTIYQDNKVYTYEQYGLGSWHEDAHTHSAPSIPIKDGYISVNGVKYRVTHLVGLIGMCPKFDVAFADATGDIVKWLRTNVDSNMTKKTSVMGCIFTDEDHQAFLDAEMELRKKDGIEEPLTSIGVVIAHTKSKGWQGTIQIFSGGDGYIRCCKNGFAVASDLFTEQAPPEMVLGAAIQLLSPTYDTITHYIEYTNRGEVFKPLKKYTKAEIEPVLRLSKEL